MNKINAIKIVRPRGDCIVIIAKDRNTDKYCFINLTGQHVCTCRFSSEGEAMKDLEHQKYIGKVLNYEFIQLDQKPRK